MREDVAAILFDEPLTVIDPHLKWLLRRKLKQVHSRFRHTLVYVTHDQTEALTFAEQVVVMYEGEVVQLGTPQELFERPAHRFVGYFIGSPGMNFLPCRLDGDGVRIDGTDASLGGLGQAAPRSPDAELELGIRPEFVERAAPRRRDDAAGPGRPGRGPRQLQARDRAARAACRQGQARRGRRGRRARLAHLAFAASADAALRRRPADRLMGAGMDKTYNNRAWLLVLPVFMLVAFSAIIPLMTVVNYFVPGHPRARQTGSGSAPTGSCRCCGDEDLHDAALSAS